MLKTESDKTYGRGCPAPVGLELETIAEQAMMVKLASRGANKNAEDNAAAAEAVETAVRAHLAAAAGEPEIASCLRQVAETLASGGYEQVASTLKQRAISLMARDLNQLDGFDR